MTCFVCYVYVIGWWYGVVGHLESCDGNENYCRCHDSGELFIIISCFERKQKLKILFLFFASRIYPLNY
uniref:Uncharacterized protein n=1 Tax=Cannabis sativa TaxID=3483 RepID=A0A803R538_CANSA